MERLADARRWEAELREAAGGLQPGWLGPGAAGGAIASLSSEASSGTSEGTASGTAQGPAVQAPGGSVEPATGWGARAGRPIYFLGSEGSRERVWLQCDAAVEGQAMTGVAATVLRSLTGDALSRYRPLLLARARIAVVPPPMGDAPGGSSLSGAAGALRPWGPGATATGAGVPPLLDAATLGLSPGLVTALDAFAPTLVVHLQDWGGGAGEGKAWRAGTRGSRDAAGLAGAGLRQVESFYMAPELHERLGAGGARRTWLGRPTALARALAAHPDAGTGAHVRRHVVQMGFRAFDSSWERRVMREDPSWPAVVRLAVGRYVPRLEWRRLGAGSLGEIALQRYGALGICGQTFDSPPGERAGAALALAEGALIYRLGLETGGPAK